MKLAWRHYIFGDKGVARGYANIEYFLFNQLLLVKELDVEAVNEGEQPESNIVVHCCPPHLFRPYANKVNVLYSMWEGPIIKNDDTLRGLRNAQQHIVPSRFCKQVWQDHGFHAWCVPLGLAQDYIESDYGRALVRDVRGAKPLRFLYVGSRQKRKGWHLIAPAWKHAFGEPANVQLYVKTIGEEKRVDRHFGGRVVVDTRDLSPRQLLKLYCSADVFVFPSYGEGFGLPPLEAMATGCLVISSQLCGLADFISGETALVLPQTKRFTIEYDVTFDIKAHTAQDVGEAMRVAYTLWGSPELEERRLNGVRWARRFTWANSAEQLASAISAATETTATRLH